MLWGCGVPPLPWGSCGVAVGHSPEEWMTRLRFCMTSIRAPTSPPAPGPLPLPLSEVSGVWGVVGCQGCPTEGTSTHPTLPPSSCQPHR